jgi:hypothetical protein
MVAPPDPRSQRDTEGNMYESRKDRPLPFRRFLRRLARHFGAVLLLLAGSLAIGMWGYGYFEDLPWRDAFLNSAMLLGGMGPVNAPLTDDGKVFAGIYALFAGLVFIFSTGILLAPLLHRLFHTLHWDR